MGKLKDCCAVHQLGYLPKEWVQPGTCAESCPLLTRATGAESQCSEMLPHRSLLWHKAQSPGHHCCPRLMRLIVLSTTHIGAFDSATPTRTRDQAEQSQLPHHSGCLAISSLPGFGFGTTLGRSLQGTWILQGKLWTVCATSLGFMLQDSAPGFV